MSIGDLIQFGKSGAGFSVYFHTLRRGPFLQGQDITCLLVRDAVLPTTEDNPQPLEGKGPYRRMVRFVALALLVIKVFRPC
jgi:hypothetical protein